MYNFNGLTPAEAERLALLLEECGEVIQIIGKTLRHGYESANPYDEHAVTNRQYLQNELGDVQAAIKLMIDSNDILEDNIIRATQDKTKRMQRWLHHQLPLPLD